MYLGERPLEYLEPFLDGYRQAMKATGQTDPLLEVISEGDLSAFMADQLKLPNQYAGENAFKMIAYVSPTQGLGAFEAFLLVLDDFLEAESFDLQKPSISDEIRERNLNKA